MPRNGTRAAHVMVLAAGMLLSACGLAHALMARPSGPIAVHPDNPGFFTFRGRAVKLITSGEHYGAVINKDFDYDVYLKELAVHGLNYTRIFVGSYVQMPGAFGIERNTLAPGPQKFIAPWARSSQPGYVGGGNRFDLNKWDEGYFKRLIDFVTKAGRAGIVVEVTLFSSLYTDKGWQASPLHPKNNINGVGKVKDRKLVHTLENGDLLGHQEKMVRKIVEALAGFDNVIFEIQNEPWADVPAASGNVTPAHPDSLAWQRRIASAIAGADAPTPHVIAQNISNRSIRVGEADAKVSLFNFHYVDPPEAVALNAEYKRAVGFDESGFAGDKDETYRRQAWHFILAGGALFNNLDYSFSDQHEDGSDKYKAPGGGSHALRKQLGVLARFVEGFGAEAVNMIPGQDFVVGGRPAKVHAFSSPGRAYGIFLEDAQSDVLQLRLPFGAYHVNWIDPVDGRSLHKELVNHAGGDAALALAKGGKRTTRDLALRLLREDRVLASNQLLPPVGHDGKSKAISPSVARVISPNGKIVVAAILADMTGTPGYPEGRRLYYQVEAHHKAKGASILVAWSPLGLKRADADFVQGLSLVSIGKAKAVKDKYRLVRGKSLSVSAVGNQATLTLRGQSGETLLIDLRAYNDGIAHRYRFAKKRAGHFRVTAEATGFRIPGAGRAYISEFDEPDQWHPSYEREYRLNMPVGTPSTLKTGWGFPALFHVGDYWMLISEAGLDASYAATRLNAQAPDGLYTVRFPSPLEGNGQGAVHPQSTLPWTLPWRVIMVGEGLGPIVQNNLITTLAAPQKMKNTQWIKPGRSSWSWWSENQSPKQYDAQVRFIDFSAEMGWQYTLVDANWDMMEGGDWRQLAKYAASKNVKILLWYNSGGENNVVSERPRNRLSDPKIRQAEFKEIAKAGVAGIKVDFFQSDKQDRIEQYLGILQDAADAGLVVNLHGCTLPRGWSRTYPNLLSMEAVRGAETYRFSRTFPAVAPSHNTMLAFSRNVVGPMDYTVTALSDTQYPHITTFAHELALAVVFESGIQHFADGVQAYRSLPAAPKAFLKTVPVVWDEVRYLSGTPGDHVVLARRKGKVWYVGGLNGTGQARTLSLNLGFTGQGPRRVQIIGDGDSDRSFADRLESLGKGTNTLDVAMRGNGGFVMVIKAGK